MFPVSIDSRWLGELRRPDLPTLFGHRLPFSFHFQEDVHDGGVELAAAALPDDLYCFLVGDGTAVRPGGDQGLVHIYNRYDAAG
jgi:hypothetical protein